MAGNGFVEQYYGSQNQDFRTMLQAVSDVVLRNVESVFLYNPTTEHMVSLVVSKEFAPMMSGLPKDVFVKQLLVTPVREITDRQGKGWRSMGLLLASSVVGGDPSKLERYTSFPEFYYTGSLIIDDIQDNWLLRRGGPCAHITHGVATAINAGTAAYFLGEGITRDHPNLTDQQRLRVYELYFTRLRGAHVGQAVDLNGVGHMMESCLSTNDFSPMWETLLCCHRLKSGLPASICARTGAVLGHASVEQEAALGSTFSRWASPSRSSTTSSTCAASASRSRRRRGSHRGEDHRTGHPMPHAPPASPPSGSAGLCAVCPWAGGVATGDGHR